MKRNFAEFINSKKVENFFIFKISGNERLISPCSGWRKNFPTFKNLEKKKAKSRRGKYMSIKESKILGKKILIFTVELK